MNVFEGKTFIVCVTELARRLSMKMSAYPVETYALSPSVVMTILSVPV